MATMDGLLVAVRAVHYGATIVLFGEVFFALLAGGPAASAQAPQRRFRRIAVAAWALMMVSGACWLALVTIQMSGTSVDGITASAVATVLRSTAFGQAWSVRAFIASMLALVWWIWRFDRPREPWVAVVSVGATGALLAGLAWAGHANADVGVHGLIHHASDAAHLLAAGAWLGGLAPLASRLGALGSSPARSDIEACATTAARFGNWAALSVGVLVLTGIVNACYLISTPRALLESTYGNLLLVKLLLFALMLALAATNRARLTPRLRAKEGDEASRSDAARTLQRNVLAEQALGAGVVLLVALLGVSSPPMRM